MSIKVKPIDVVLFAELDNVPRIDLTDAAFIDACRWSRSLYPLIYTQCGMSRGGSAPIDWSPTSDVDIDIRSLLAVTDYNHQLKVAGPANCIAAVVGYIKNNKGLVEASPSVYNALNNYLVSIFR